MFLKDFNPLEEFEDVIQDLWLYVYNRDEGLCQACGGLGCHAHHIKYRSHSGKNSASNLVILCFDCHHKEHNVEAHDEGCFYDRVKKNEQRLRERLV